jgi:hypothetical protein
MSAAQEDAERQARLAASIARHEAPVKPQYIRPATATTAATQPDQVASAHAGKGGKRGKVRRNPAAAKWVRCLTTMHRWPAAAGNTGHPAVCRAVERHLPVWRYMQVQP